MIVLVLIVAAGALLAVGIGVDSTVLDAVALGIAALSVVIVLGTWLLPLLKKSESAVDETPASEVDETSAPEVEDTPTPEVKEPRSAVTEPPREPEITVVFVAGRTTFHLDSCSLVAGKATSRAQRGDLEAGGMAACKRCLKT